MYDSAGYIVDFDSNNKLTKEKIRKLRRAQWIDEDTRAV